MLLSLGLGSQNLGSQNTITIASNGATPVAPLSAGGSLLVVAPAIVQNGALYAPLGTIQLGVSASAPVPSGITLVGTAPTTNRVTLGAGSLTSVSADGETTLYGHVQNGTDWIYGLASADPTQTGSQLGITVVAPPAKQISLVGANISVASGARVDASGGGDLYAGEFVQGTGGSKNIFTSTSSSNVYAVIPGYTGTTPYDPETSTSGPSLGQQVYLSGVPGLAAGTYTLLPGAYAELPGAFRVTVQIAPGASTIGATRSPIATVAQADGSYLASGYMVTPGSGRPTNIGRYSR